MNLRDRVEKLEGATQAPVAYAWQEAGDSPEMAMDRWKAAHPFSRARVVCVGWLPAANGSQSAPCSSGSRRE